MTRLTDLDHERASRIVDITAEPVVRERLLEMGLSPGRSIKVLWRLPFFGPLIVQAGSLFLALRFVEAEQVWIE
jgi:Fe2+ transport system protein FeoA